MASNSYVRTSMSKLPVCKYRGDQSPNGNYACDNGNCLIVSARGVSAQTCMRCYYADRDCPPPREPTTVVLNGTAALSGVDKLQTCIHAGRAIRTETGEGKKELCRTCGGDKELQVFACAKIGETHAGKCGPCGLYEPKPNAPRNPQPENLSAP